MNTFHTTVIIKISNDIGLSKMYSPKHRHFFYWTWNYFSKVEYVLAILVWYSHNLLIINVLIERQRPTNPKFGWILSPIQTNKKGILWSIKFYYSGTRGLSLTTSQVVIMTTFGVARGDEVGIVTVLSLQCWIFLHRTSFMPYNVILYEMLRPGIWVFMLYMKLSTFEYSFYTVIILFSFMQYAPTRHCNKLWKLHSGQRHVSQILSPSECNFCEKFRFVLIHILISRSLQILAHGTAVVTRATFVVIWWQGNELQQNDIFITFEMFMEIVPGH